MTETTPFQQTTWNKHISNSCFLIFNIFILLFMTAVLMSAVNSIKTRIWPRIKSTLCDLGHDMGRQWHCYCHWLWHGAHCKHQEGVNKTSRPFSFWRWTQQSQVQKNVSRFQNLAQIVALELFYPASLKNFAWKRSLQRGWTCHWMV